MLGFAAKFSEFCPRRTLLDVRLKGLITLGKVLPNQFGGLLVKPPLPGAESGDEVELRAQSYATIL